MKVGTKSVLFGAHCWFIHPWFVAAAWMRLYGFPVDPRLWVAFFVHDLGYWGKPNMDGPEGEAHVEWGANVMHRLFDGQCELCRYFGVGTCSVWMLNGPLTDDCELRGTKWRDLCLYHSRFYAKRAGQPFSRLCVADKLAVALEPWWLYLPRVIASGEIREYMDLAEQRPGSKYRGEKRCSTAEELQGLSPRRAWWKRMSNYCRKWAMEHRDCRPDTWTPAPAKEVDTSALCMDCKTQPHDDWPWGDGHLCQRCWESRCSKTWWQAVDGEDGPNA